MVLNNILIFIVFIILLLIVVAGFNFMFLNRMTYVEMDIEHSITYLESLDMIGKKSENEIHQNKIKMNKLKCNIRNDELVEEINVKIDKLEDLISCNKNIISENKQKTNNLSDINKNIDVMIAVKKDYEVELSNLNNNIENIIVCSSEKITKINSLNESLSVIIDKSQIEIDKMINKYNEITCFNDNIKNRLIKITSNNLGDDIINGNNRQINMNEDTIFLKTNIYEKDNYYIPIYHVDDINV